VDLVRGMFVGEHELLEQAGAGGFSVVWKARHPESGKLVAIKFPKVETLIEHLRREAGVLAWLKHPQLVPVLETRFEAEPPHLVMPWIEGQRLEIPKTAPEPRQIVKALRIVRDLAEVLGYVHASGIAHGDVKPGNVLVDEAGRPHLLDLGLARLQVATRLERSLAQSLVSVDGKSIAGTLDYMAPELFDGKKPEIAADVYALGVLLHGLLTGRPPAFGVSPSSLNPYLPPGIESLLRGMLHHDPELRIRSAEVVLPDLDRFIAEEERCLAKKNGHERRRVFEGRMRTLRKGLNALLTLAALVTIVVGLFVVGLAFTGGANSDVAQALIGISLFFGGTFFFFMPLLLGITTINAWLLRVPEKTYKNRSGHPIWSFMMQ
jgi:serine/threonine protein kinase